jgi:hypothetical protein
LAQRRAPQPAGGLTGTLGVPRITQSQVLVQEDIDL